MSPSPVCFRLDPLASATLGASAAATLGLHILVRAARGDEPLFLTSGQLRDVTWQVLTRYQRFLRARNAPSVAPAFAGLARRKEEPPS